MAKKLALKVLPDSDRLRYLSFRSKWEKWRAAREGKQPKLRSRLELYDYLNEKVLVNQPVLFLEFGVFRGESIAYWAGINSHQRSHFVGFDTFRGLPDEWRDFSRTVERHAFDTGGEVPMLADERVSFVKGLFQDSVPGWLAEHSVLERLVVHIDCDLYSSALFVLSCLNPIMGPGAIVLFDEFYSVMHEFRALEDYCSAYLREYDVIAATRAYDKVAIEMK